MTADDRSQPDRQRQLYTGPERRRFDCSMPLSGADVRLLVLAEHGYTYQPTDAAEGVLTS
jgi:hypothetical protein